MATTTQEIDLTKLDPETTEIDGIPVTKLKELREKGRRWLYVTAEGPVVVRRATQIELDRCIDEMGDEDKSKSAATRNLTLQCAVYPDRAGMLALLKELPGAGFSIGNEILQISGIKKNVEGKKF